MIMLIRLQKCGTGICHVITPPTWILIKMTKCRTHGIIQNIARALGCHLTDPSSSP